ncbi:hypothetical protein [Myceligenerans crystallogenes]
MNTETGFEFHEVIDSFARLDSIALRVEQDVLEIRTGQGDPTRIDGLTVYVTMSDARAAQRLVTRHRMVPGQQSALALSRTWCAWLPDASHLLPVSVRLTLVTGG